MPSPSQCFLLLLLLLLATMMPGVGADDERAKEVAHGGKKKTSVGLEWVDICCSTKTRRLRPGRRILKHISGKARPGRLLAIMGPSGSGKTTLLNTLAGQVPYQPHLTLTGEVSIMGLENKTQDTTNNNNLAATFSLDQHDCSYTGAGFVYVRQEDLFYSHLTVRETLQFASRLRLPRAMSWKEKEAAVEEMILRMGLSEVADTLVGDEKKRGISGGERKRLSLACELIGNPSKIVFADEPTSGLDSFQAQIVMQSFKELCQDGHTVVVSIHQPRSTVYQMFDDIILLSDGNVMFHGPAGDATAYFDKLGYNCPNHFNPAEFMLDLVSVDNSCLEERRRTMERVKSLADAYAKSKEVGQHCSVGVPVKDYLLERAKRRVPRAGWLTQFRLLIGRQWKQTSRDVFTNGVRAIASVALAALFGSIFWKLGLNEASIQERSAVLMHTCINTGMIATVKTLNLFTRERAIVSRERTKNSYDISAYVLSKVVGELPIDAFFPAIFGSILYPMVGLQTGQYRFLKFLASISLQTLAGSAIGMAIGAIVPSTETALSLGPSIMVVFILLSGQVGTSNDKIPAAIRWIQDISIMRWAFEAVCVNEFTGLVFDKKNPSPFARLPGAPKIIRVSGKEVMSKLGLPPNSSVERALQAQTWILLANYLLTYLGLKFRSPQFQPLLPPPSKQKSPVRERLHGAVVNRHREHKEQKRATTPPRSTLTEKKQSMRMMTPPPPLQVPH